MNIPQLNRVVEEFDRVTNYQFDTETDLDTLCDIAQFDLRVPHVLFGQMLDTLAEYTPNQTLDTCSLCGAHGRIHDTLRVLSRPETFRFRIRDNRIEYRKFARGTVVCKHHDSIDRDLIVER